MNLNQQQKRSIIAHKDVKGKYVMFVHQDIDLLTDSWLKSAEDMLDSIPNLGIAGVAGKLNIKKGIITNINDGNSS